ncbi:UDP-3-O-[3-hydroxymyristoyl] glucosamine N-acyltransferase [Lishizhenia tianjinensis]|uniref:UDP-3-O-acylglucosamine N-acyltransferase n=1 Tax=Lishizhenia tianjinensis TaxID=477690 RepID=A0A1I7AL10_9FLAO|nr:UDP-3-O-(3-hydroxymyristoyl)glucosamine N-acyltransferase [Lishizhenia tianjinensis]SFT75580.1 UDP-3-O-[3-hydroxymyristoyl] glucosamine N-acyltransferase [Lishizhenia tianjinensis]
MKFTAEQIAGIIKGDIEGNKDVTVSGLSKIEEGQEGTLSFLANMKYEEHIYTTGASIAIVDRAFTPSKELPSTLTLIKVDDAYSCFAQLLEVYNQMRTKQPKIEQPSFIDENATIGKDVYVGAFAYIADGAEIGDNVKIYPNVYIGENVKIGAGTVINPGAAVYADCVVGENCLIHGGAIIGADGFGFAPDENGEFQKVPQIGNVVLEDNVEVGSNATIDRATLGSTILRRGVKLDNLVHLAHNVEVGKNSAMAAQVGVAGSAKIGENVMIGGQAGISGHIKIADRTKIVAQSGVPGNVKKPDQTLMGTPGIPIDDFKKSFFGFRKLPYILQKLRELEDKISNK